MWQSQPIRNFLDDVFGSYYLVELTAGLAIDAIASLTLNFPWHHNPWLKRNWQLWHIEIVEAAKIAEQKAKEMSELATAITQKYQKRLLDFMQTSTEKQEE